MNVNDWTCIKRIQADLRNTAGLVPDHHHKASIMRKQIVIFLLVKSLTFNL